MGKKVVMGNYARPGRLVLSMRLAVFMESPNRLNLGSLLPMRPLRWTKCMERIKRGRGAASGVDLSLLT